MTPPISQTDAQKQAIVAPLMNLRWTALCLGVFWLICLLLIDAEPWRLLIPCLLPLPIGIMTWRLKKGLMLPYRAVLGAMLLGQTAMACATGGIYSPMCGAVLVTSIFASIGVPEPRHALPYLFGAVLALSGMAVVDLMGYDLRPEALRQGLWMPVGIAVTLGGLAIGGAAVGVQLHRAIKRTRDQVTAFQQEALEALSERNRDLSLMTGAIAHELKNPLSAIQGLSTFLAEEAEVGSPEAEQLAVLVQEVRRTSRIVDDFLNFSRPLVPERLEAMPIGPLVDGLLAVHQGLAEARHVSLERAGEGAPVRCDPRKIKHILVNLIQNGIEASPEGGAVKVALATEGVQMQISVIDQGAGPDAELGEQVFRPGITTRGRGSGLGLPIARTLARAHGGDVTLKAGPTGGGIALLSLPLAGPTQAEASSLASWSPV